MEKQKRLSAAEAVEILKDNGLEVSEEQAALILDFLYEMADIVLIHLANEA
ncbi:hypothetical protein [Pedobacter sp. GR22-6]|uniref:hypothetical protein n=1 Tax=Pedobacter sp. GR22-6 TaxID=3127957 RepID=UPI00307D802B